MRSASESELYRVAVEAGAEITQALVHEDAPAVIARRVGEALDAWECDLYEYDPDARALTAIALWARAPTPADEAWIGTRLRLDDRPSFATVIEGGRCVISSVDDPGLDAADREEMLAWSERSALTVPLRFRDRGVVGCLTLVEKRPDRQFAEEDVARVTLLAGPAAVAVRNSRLFRLQHEQNRYLASLLATSRALTSTVTLEDSLTQICRTAAETLQTDECIIYEYDGPGDALIFRAFFGHVERPAELELGVSYAFADYPSDREILSRGVVVQEIVSDPALGADARASMERWGEKTCLNVPLVVEGQPLGLLVLIETTRERTFGSAEVDLARALGEQAATAIRHAWLYRRGSRQNRRLKALLETSRLLVSSLDVEAVLGELRRKVVDLFGVEGDAVGLLRRRGDAYVPFVRRGERGRSGEEATAVELDNHQRRAVADLAPVVVDGDPARLVVPFVAGGAVDGLLDVRGGAGWRTPDDDELELVQILADQAAAALANATLYHTLERQAVTDGLTGLFNHRYFYERLNQEIARAQRYGLPLALLMIDIDDFKKFNDRYGHPVGDLVLTEVGRILGNHVRGGIDIAARYGGEEFAVVLPNTSRDGAQVVGGRLVRELSALPAAAPDGEGAVTVSERIRTSVAEATLPGVDDAARITVSVGVACIPGHAGGPGDLVRNADKALYLAKRLGKNRVEVFGE